MSNSNLLPISSYQTRFFIEWAIDPFSSKYNQSFVHKITGDLDKQAFKKTIELLVDRFDVLHAFYNAEGSECYYGDFGIDQFYKEILEPDQEVAIVKKIESLLHQPFDLKKGPLVRFYLIEQSEDIHYFVISIHHVIYDAMFGSIINKQIEIIYNALVTHKKPPYFPADQFSQAITSEKKNLSSRNHEEAKKYWRDLIQKDINLTLDLPSRLPDREEFKGNGYLYFKIDKVKTKTLNSIAKKNNTTLFVLLSSLFSIVLSKYSEYKKFAISYPMNMRPREFLEVMGCFVNNAPLVFDFEKSDKFSDLIRDVVEQRNKGKEYYCYPFSQIIYTQSEVRDESYDSYFNIGIAD